MGLLHLGMGWVYFILVWVGLLHLGIGWVVFILVWFGLLHLGEAWVFYILVWVVPYAPNLTDTYGQLAHKWPEVVRDIS